MSWKTVGMFFAKTARVSAKVAMWASSHPEVLTIIQEITKHE